MKLTPLRTFAVVLLAGAALAGGSALFSALGDAASQRSDFGVVALFLVALVVVAAVSAAVVAAFTKAKKAAEAKDHEDA